MAGGLTTGKPKYDFSCAGFDELPPEGRTTDRVIANVTAGALAAYLAGLNTHEDGALDCPFDYNAERAFKRAVGPQKFDKFCRDKVVAGLGEETVAAAERLLKLFQGR